MQASYHTSHPLEKFPLLASFRYARPHTPKNQLIPEKTLPYLFREIIKTPQYAIPPTNLETEERIFQQNHKMIYENGQYLPFSKASSAVITFVILAG